MGAGLQPLRVPPGWRIDWNTLFEEDPTEPANASGYYFGGTDLFLATNASRRLAIDIEWRTEPDKQATGRYRMRLLRIVEPNAVESSGSESGAGLNVNWDDPIRDFETAMRAELVVELEAWLAEELGQRRTKRCT